MYEDNALDLYSRASSLDEEEERRRREEEELLRQQQALAAVPEPAPVLAPSLPEPAEPPMPEGFIEETQPPPPRAEEAPPIPEGFVEEPPIPEGFVEEEVGAKPEELAKPKLAIGPTKEAAKALVTSKLPPPDVDKNPQYDADGNYIPEWSRDLGTLGSIRSGQNEWIDAFNSFARGTSSEGGILSTGQGLYDMVRAGIERTGLQDKPIFSEIHKNATHERDQLAAMRERVNARFPVDENFQKDFGGVFTGLGQLTNMPIYMAPGGAFLGGVTTVGQLWQEAKDDYRQTVKEKGLPYDEAQADKAALQYITVAGPLEYAADKFLIGRFLHGAAAKKWTIDKALVEGGKSFLSEGSTEGAQQMWLNFVAQNKGGYGAKPYDPSRPLGKEVGASFLVGGLVGAGGGVVSHAAGAALKPGTITAAPAVPPAVAPPPAAPALSEAFAPPAPGAPGVAEAPPGTIDIGPPFAGAPPSPLRAGEGVHTSYGEASVLDPVPNERGEITVRHSESGNDLQVPLDRVYQRGEPTGQPAAVAAPAGDERFAPPAALPVAPPEAVPPLEPTPTPAGQAATQYVSADNLRVKQEADQHSQSLQAAGAPRTAEAIQQVAAESNTRASVTAAEYLAQAKHQRAEEAAEAAEKAAKAAEKAAPAPAAVPTPAAAAAAPAIPAAAPPAVAPAPAPVAAPPREAAAEPESAVVVGGQVFTGATHPEAVQAAHAAVGPDAMRSHETGWVNPDTGRFVSHEIYYAYHALNSAIEAAGGNMEHPAVAEAGARLGQAQARDEELNSQIVQPGGEQVIASGVKGQEAVISVRPSQELAVPLAGVTVSVEGVDAQGAPATAQRPAAQALNDARNDRTALTILLDCLH